MCGSNVTINRSVGHRRFTVPDKAARARSLKRLSKALEKSSDALEEIFNNISSREGLMGLERKRVMELIGTINSFKYECKGRAVSIKEKLDEEDS